MFTLPLGDLECGARVWHLPAGARPLLRQLFDRLDAVPPLTPEAVIEGLTVVQTTVRVPCDGALAKRMGEIGGLAIPVPRDYSIAIDGTAFRLEVRKGARGLTFDTHTGGLDAAYEEPVVAWMAAVGRAFRSLLFPITSADH